MDRPAGKISFLAFHLVYAKLRNWVVPDIHVRACHWLEHCDDHGVMLCFRGFAKSTLLAEYNAWRYYLDPTYRILHQGADDQMAYKTSRDVQRVLRSHPYCAGLLPDRPGPVEQWWVVGSDDERNASLFAKGITSTTTSSRADECQNDDVEVPKNITNTENREKMRDRLGEQIHIMVPGARQLFIGTPHTHDSLYDERVRLGADLLKIPMFGLEHRIDQASSTVYPVPFTPNIAFAGIGESTQLLLPDRDYVMSGARIVFIRPPGMLVDLYADCAWPERFDPAELLKRRKLTRTINAWDSQYQLHSKPLSEIRLDPARIQAYAEEPVFRTANRVPTLWLGGVQIVTMSLHWDPSSGKVGSDISGVVLDLQDRQGRHYWHRVLGLTGDIAQTNDDGTKILGGQVFELCDLIEKFHVPRIVIESNGIGGFAGKFLSMALKQRRLHCAILEEPAVRNKAARILDALEPIITGGMLWAHESVLKGPLWDQMKDWNPQATGQADDLLDAGAGAVTDQPARIGSTTPRTPDERRNEDWRPGVGVYEATLE
jgi:hypothetical protein